MIFGFHENFPGCILQSSVIRCEWSGPSWKTNPPPCVEAENDDVKEISRSIHKEYIHFQGFILRLHFSLPNQLAQV